MRALGMRIAGQCLLGNTVRNPCNLDVFTFSSAHTVFLPDSIHDCNKATRINYFDPSGYFTEEAVYNYLYDYYYSQCRGNVYCAEAQTRSMLFTWKNDKEWWAMIASAQAGDVLFGGVGIGWKGEVQFGEMYEFQGEGQGILKGITPYKQQGSSDVTLMDFQVGFQQIEGMPSGYGMTRTWLGYSRFDEGTVKFWIRDGYEKKDYITPESTRQIINWVWSGYSAAAGLLLPGINLTAKVTSLVISLFITPIPQLYLDARDMESNDVQVYIGPAYFNFQFSIENGGWNIEHYHLR